jgi:hypothetical protein
VRHQWVDVIGCGRCGAVYHVATIAAGVPRSFPFHGIAIHFHSPTFGGAMHTQAHTASMMAEIVITDSWWINGRNRSLSARTIVEGEALTEAGS